VECELSEPSSLGQWMAPAQMYHAASTSSELTAAARRGDAAERKLLPSAAATMTGLAAAIRALRPGQVSFLGDAESSLGDAKSSLGDAESSLGDAESSLGDV
jgi:hypothetical protein